MNSSTKHNTVKTASKLRKIFAIIVFKKGDLKVSLEVPVGHSQPTPDVNRRVKVKLLLATITIAGVTSNGN